MRSARSILLATFCCVLLAGCFTGKRAHLAPEEPTVDDAAIAAVLDRLDIETDGAYTATYSIVLKFGNVTTDAVVTQSSSAARSITIGDVRFLDADSGQQTCDLTTSVCTTGLNDATISDVVPSHDFYRASAAARLRQDATTTTAAGVPSTKEVAGQMATCVEVTFTEGSKQYCALDNGLLAFQDAPDVQIDLVTWTATSDPALFTPTTVAG